MAQRKCMASAHSACRFQVAKPWEEIEGSPCQTRESATGTAQRALNTELQENGGRNGHCWSLDQDYRQVRLGDQGLCRDKTPWVCTRPHKMEDKGK